MLFLFVFPWKILEISPHKKKSYCIPTWLKNKSKLHNAKDLKTKTKIETEWSFKGIEKEITYKRITTELTADHISSDGCQKTAKKWPQNAEVIKST